MEGATTTVVSNALHPAVFPSQQDPVPLSFPAILRNPGLNGRFAHLTDNNRAASPSAAAKKIGRRDDNNGKRWVRRKENDRFVGNPHIVLATRQDYGVQLPKVKSTFPEPLPAYLLRTAKLPSTGSPVVDPSSANYGRFSLSLKGMRRELRRSGRRAQFLVRDVEQAMTDWLATAGAVLASDGSQSMGSERQMIGECQTIHEVSRTPFQLVWSCDGDPFARYVVHCCARYHDVVSYSKEVSGERFTYLLRPNVTRPDFFAPAAIATPPVTDIDSSSQFDTESDFTDLDELSDVDEVASLAASSRESLVHVMQHDSEEAWSVSGGTDSEAELLGNEPIVPASISVTIGSLDDTPRRHLPIRARPRIPSHTVMRSSSSPSRSPARLSFAPRRLPTAASSKPSFYAYLFS